MAGLYPGVKIDLRYYPQERDKPIYPIGAHHDCCGTTSEMLPVREVAMMILMDRLTDKPNWQEKVFDEEIVSKWRSEAMEQPEDDLYAQITEGKTMRKIPMPRRVRIVEEDVFDFCIGELRCKAAHFKKTGLIPTLDSDGNTIVKSDTLVSPELQKGLNAAFDKLRADQASNVDWHPRSGDMVQDLVHPSMYPFVFGRSKFIEEEVVGVSNAIDKWTGKGEIVPQTETPTERGYGGGSYVPPQYWSNKYQWLPANLAFQDDGTVRFTSYVNNLHPAKYPGIYRTIETLIDTAIPAWDQCLSEYRKYNKVGVGRRESRFGKPDRCDDEDEELWEAFDPEVFAEHNPKLTEDEIFDIQERARYDAEADEDDETMESMEETYAAALEDAKWAKVRDMVMPETDGPPEVDYSCEESIREKFKELGLQVIVKMASIELTPEKPDFPVGGWHIEGQMNERICATALYYVSSENVTPSHLSFRMQTSLYQDEITAGQDSYNYLERVYGTALCGADACLQNYGSVETKQGRLLAFPNVFQHRVSPFSLKDATKPGHRRFIALWLVDPHQRIVSTANVPPQQLDWWAEAVFGADATASRGDVPPEVFKLLLEKGLDKNFPGDATSADEVDSRLPPELLEMVREQGVMPEGLMSVEEARQHRLELMDERSSFHQVSEHEWQNVTYSFCEH